MVKEGIVLGQKILITSLEVDKAKIDLIEKFTPPTPIKVVRSFLGYADFYKRFIKNFLAIVRPMCKLLEKDIEFEFDMEFLQAFDNIKEKLIKALVMVT